MFFSDNSDEKIQLDLSGPQWELLRASRKKMDEGLARSVSVAIKSGGKYQLYLSSDDLDTLIWFVDDEIDRTTDKEKRQILSDLADYLSDFEDEEAYDFWGLNRSKIAPK